jgi:hypothetical protein
MPHSRGESSNVRTRKCTHVLSASLVNQQSTCAKGSRDLATRGPLTDGLRAGPIVGPSPEAVANANRWIAEDSNRSGHWKINHLGLLDDDDPNLI